MWLFAAAAGNEKPTAKLIKTHEEFIGEGERGEGMLSVHWEQKRKGEAGGGADLKGKACTCVQSPMQRATQALRAV